MTSLFMNLATAIFVVLLGLIIFSSQKQLDWFIPRLSLSRLSQLRSLFPTLFSLDHARACKAAEILDQVEVELLDRYQVEEKYSPDTWQRKAYDDLTSALLRTDKIFPCIYGTKGYKSNELDFVFAPSENLSDLEVAKFGAKAIVEYHKILRTRGRNISLILLCPPPTIERSVEDYHKLFWGYLKRMRELDPKIWPSKIPHDTSDRTWCMNFDGFEAFFAVLCPSYKNRLSRYAPNFGFVYQPRVIFDVVFKDPRYRESATTMVRNLVDKYDGIPRSPDISDYAVEGTTESRQYFLLDENVSAVCPYESLEVVG